MLATVWCLVARSLGSFGVAGISAPWPSLQERIGWAAHQLPVTGPIRSRAESSAQAQWTAAEASGQLTLGWGWCAILPLCIVSVSFVVSLHVTQSGSLSPVSRTEKSVDPEEEWSAQ